MKFICEKEDLARAVSIVGRLATTRATLPILQNIYLETEKDSLILKATDLEQTIQMTVNGQVADGGKITVPSRLLSDYLQNNSDHSITLSTDDTTLKVSSANHTATLLGLPAEEYPTVPDISVEKSITLEAKSLIDAITKTVFATATDDTRPVLTGLLWRFSEKKLELVGTDGYRLAHLALPTSSNLSGDYIIPRRTLQELSRLIDQEQLELSFAGSQVRFKAGPVQLTSRILEGKFPDYTAILPKKKELSVSLPAAALLQSLKLASLFSRDSAFSTKIKIEGQKLKVQAVSAQLGDSSNEVGLDAPVEGEFLVSVNAQYLIDALSQVGGDVNLELVDAKSPVVLKPKADENYLYLVMPLRSE